MNKLLKNSSIYALGDIIPKLLGFITFPILTRYLSTADYGIINYIGSINAFLGIFSMLGLNTYFLVYYFRVGDIEEQKKLLGNLSIFIVGINLIGSAVFLLIGQSIFYKIGATISFYPYMVIGLLTNLFNVLFILPSALFRVQEKPLPLTILNVLRGVLTLILTLVLVVFFDFKALGVLLSTLIITVIFSLIFVYVTIKNMIFNINWLQLKEALVFSLPLLPGSLSYYLTTMSDRILIDKFLNLSALGIYSTASTIALILNIISYGAYKAFEPYFFQIYGTQFFEEQFHKVRDKFFFLILIAALGLALFSKEFLQIMVSQDYQIAYYYVPFILIGLLASSISLMYATVVTARNKTKINSMNSILAGLVSFSLNIFLLPKIGIIGACISSIISYCLMLFLSIYFSNLRLPHMRLVISFIIGVVLVYLMNYYIDIYDVFYSVLLKLISYLLIVFLLAIILKINIKAFKI